MYLRRYRAELKAEMALTSLTARQPLAELAAHFQLSTAQITHWKLQLRQQAARVFAEVPASVAPTPDVVYAAIGRLQMENALLKKRCPDEYGQAARLGAVPGLEQQFGGRPLPGPGLGPQQFLQPALQGKPL